MVEKSWEKPDQPIPRMKFGIVLPNGAWKGQKKVEMDYPPPEAILWGKCLWVTWHSQDPEHTLNTFYRNMSKWALPETDDPDRDFCILFPDLNHPVGLYFSIAELRTCLRHWITHQEWWQEFKDLRDCKLKERTDYLENASVKKQQQSVKDWVGKVIL